MAFYQLCFEQIINSDSDSVWEFISTPSNLKKITPPYMGFEITSKTSSDKMYPGQIITYKVCPVPGIKTSWMTEITHISEGKYFVDEQRIGPYKLWHHYHRLDAINETQTKMTDIVTYAPPFGALGRLANHLFIRKKLNSIFAYREEAIVRAFR